MQQTHQTDVCVWDFSKAFDKIWHIRLIDKLKWSGMAGKAVDWMNSSLSQRTQCVVLDGISLSKPSVASRVPQRSLGSMLILVLHQRYCSKP